VVAIPVPHYSHPLAFAAPASAVGGVPTTFSVTYTNDNGPGSISSGDVQIDEQRYCYLSWDSAGNITLYPGSSPYSTVTGRLGQSGQLFAGNCTINLASSTLSTPAGNPNALVLSLNVIFPEQDYLSSGNNAPADFVGQHEVYAVGYSTASRRASFPTSRRRHKST